MALVSRFIAIAFLLSFLFSCKEEDLTEHQQNTLCNPKIMSYHFGVEALPVSQQIRLLDSLGMDGIMLQIETGNLPALDDYFNASEVKNKSFVIYDIFTSIFLDNDSELARQIATIESIYKRIQHEETVLQVLFHGSPGSEKAGIVIAQIADIAKRYGKSIIIYPHEGLAIESAEQAMNYIKAVNKDNVFLALHLCHELAAGNGARIGEVIKNVAPYIKAVSISGATVGERLDNTLPEWYWAIKPLNMGTYDFKPFYAALNNYGYNGPIAIHTWGIFENFGLAPKDHLPESKAVLLNLASDICK